MDLRNLKETDGLQDYGWLDSCIPDNSTLSTLLRVQLAILSVL